MPDQDPPDTTPYYESLLTRDGIRVNYTDAEQLVSFKDEQIVSFKDSTFNINRGLNVTKGFSTIFSTQLTVISTGHFKGTLKVDGAFNVKSTLLIDNKYGGLSLTVNGTSKLKGPTNVYNTLSV